MTERMSDEEFSDFFLIQGFLEYGASDSPCVVNIKYEFLHRLREEAKRAREAEKWLNLRGDIIKALDEKIVKLEKENAALKEMGKVNNAS